MKNNQLNCEQKAEAIARMKMLEMHNNAISEFEKDNMLNFSEMNGALYWLDERQQEYVSKFQDNYHAVVYHVLHTMTEFGELLAFLYVSDCKEEWSLDRDDLRDGYAFAYVVNMDEPLFSEFGSVGVRPLFGGVVRTA